MRKVFLTFSMAVLFLTIAAQSDFAQSKPHTPAKGSAERKAILNGVRRYRNAPNELYTPTTFNVQNGWAVIYARDPNDPDVDTEAIYVLLHKTGKSWKVVADLMAVEGSDGSREIENARKKFPAAPAAIFKTTWRENAHGLFDVHFNSSPQTRTVSE